MPVQRLAQFELNLGRSRDLVGLGQAVKGLTSGRVDNSEMYRAALVLAVGALESYVHGVVLDRAVDILLGRITGGADDRKVGLPFGAVSQIIDAQNDADRELAARTHVAQRLSLETYQKPEDIGKAFAMVGISKLWSSAFTDAGAATLALSLVVRRRNAIAHQCDADPVTHSQITPFSDADALYAIGVVQETVRAIDKLC
jgi:hypothetical protein